MRTPTDRDLARHRRSIQRTLSKHFETPTVEWALRVVETELFRYQAAHEFRYQLWTADRLHALKASGVRPLHVLQRVVECYALRGDDECGTTFPNQRCWLSFLARKVLRLKHGKLLAHSNAARLANAGELIAEVLGKFAAATLMQMDKDSAERASFDAACNTFASEE